MAIALRAAATSANINNSTIAVNLPAGTTVGDVTIMLATQASPTVTLTPPAGWTVLYSNFGFLVLYRVFQSGDPSTVTFNSSVSAYWEIASISYSGCDTANPIDVSMPCVFYRGSANSAASTLYRAPSLNPNFAGDQLVCLYANNSQAGGVSITKPGSITQQAMSAGGPSVFIGDLALSNGTPTGNLDAAWGAQNALPQFGMQIALKAAGAAGTTVASPAIGVAGIAPIAVIGSATIPLSQLDLQPGDLVVVAMSSTSPVTPPAGYTQQQSGGGTYVFTHPFSAGDSTSPVFTVSTGDVNACAYVLRKMGTGTNNPAVDTSGINTATSTAATPSLTPAGSGEFLMCAFGNNSAVSATWSAVPAGLTNDINSGWGPSLLVGWAEPAANPTGSFSATNSVAAPVGAIATLFNLASAPPPPPTTGGEPVMFVCT